MSKSGNPREFPKINGYVSSLSITMYRKFYLIYIIKYISISIKQYDKTLHLKPFPFNDTLHILRIF